MTKGEIIDRLRSGSVTLYKLTGPPEHWLTTYNTGFWGFRRRDQKAWSRLKPGDLCLFHSTAILTESVKRAATPKTAPPSVIGVGIVSDTSQKQTDEWVQEFEGKHNEWPLLVHFEGVWWLGDVEAIADGPMREKLRRGSWTLVPEIRALTSGAVRFGDLTYTGSLGRTRWLIGAQGSIKPVRRPAVAAGHLERKGGAVRRYGGMAGAANEAPLPPPLGEGLPEEKGTDGIGPVEVKTGVTEKGVEVRVGQERFSAAVRDNYGHRCCFPECEVVDEDYLVASHIVRWADDEEVRGRVDNGLLLCLMHDKAFECGHFFLDSQGRVRTSSEQVGGSVWARAHVLDWVGQRVREGKIRPAPEYLAAHRARVEKRT